MRRKTPFLMWLALAGAAPMACDPGTSATSPHLDVQAGEDQTIKEGETATLSASVEGQTENYAFHWDAQTSSPAPIAAPDSPTTEVGPLNVLGGYKFRVVASSVEGRFGQDFVVVTVEAQDQDNDNQDNDNQGNDNGADEDNANDNAGDNQNENEAENDNAAQNENQADENDNQIEVDPEDVTLRANAPQSYSVGVPVPLIASQPPGAQEATYQWAVIDGQAQIDDAAARETKVTAEVPGEVTVRVTMTVPEFDRTYEDEVTINFEPADTFTIYISGPTEGLTGVPIDLTASAVNAEVGMVVQNAWEIVEGEGELGATVGPRIGFTPTAPGVIVLQVTAYANGDPAGVDDYAFVAYANPTILLEGIVENFALVSEPTTLSVTSTNFADEDITYNWRVVSGAVTLTGQDTPTPEVVASAAGTAELELTAEAVIDDLSRSGSRAVYVTAAPDLHPHVTMVVEGFGSIPIELDAEAAPIAVANFLHYVDDQAYDGSLINRVIPDFIIQAGTMTLDGGEVVELPPARDPIPNESDNGLSNVRGTVAMALMQDQPDSGDRSWFINLSDDNTYLDEAQHTVFGKVTGGGMDVADAISLVERGQADDPLDPVVITSIRRDEQD